MARVTDGGGLRERKRTAAMYRIQSVALDLFEERGFDEVTVEEIAEASEVSPSSVYRYFGTKEQIVLWDEFDPALERFFAESFAAPVPLDGLRKVFVELLGGLGPDDEQRIVRRLRLALGHPTLEQAAIAATYTVAETVEQLLAAQLRRPVVDLEVQVFAHAFVGGLLGMFHHWQGTGFVAPLGEILERTFDIFEEGLDIVTAAAPAEGAPASAPPGAEGAGK